MDSHRFDRLAKTFGASTSRRGVLAALLAGVIAPLMNPSDDAAGRGRNTRQGKPKRQKGTKNGRSNRGQSKKQVPRLTQSEAVRCCSRENCTPGAGKNLSKCCYKDANLTGRNFRGANLGSANFSGATLTRTNFAGANLGKACLVNADLTGATINGSTNLGGTIFCRTTMPDGSTNNAGCTKATRCCETCNLDPGEDCAAAGDVCCQGATCEDGTCSCPASKPDLCAGGCVDLETDRNNCGECGDACGQGETCQAGACGEACGAGFCPGDGEKPTCCGETCTDTETDRDNCGRCDEECAAGRDCCAGDCIDTSTDQNNCGACGNPCGPRRLCENGGCNQCDVCPIGCIFTSVQAAVDAANDGKVIRICPGTWVGDVTISGLIPHAEKLVLIGAGDGANPADNTILQGTGGGSVVSINGRIVTLQELRITGGSAGDGGGIAVLKGNLTITGCTVTENTATAAGGGLFVDNSTLAMTGCTVSRNTGPAAGIQNSGSTVILTNSSVTDNTAAPGSAGGINNAGDLTLANSSVTGNRANGNGGGIVNAAKLTLNDSRVTGNTAGERGGGIFNSFPQDDPSTVTITNSNVTGNTANGGPGSGGGIYNEGTVVFNSGALSPNVPDNCLDIPPQGQGCTV